MADSDPPRKTFRLKPKEFERVNDPRPPPASADQSPAEPAVAMPSPGTAQPMPETAAPIDVRAMARQATTQGPLLRTKPSAVHPPNEMQAVLRENVVQANAHGLNDVILPPKRKSRRKRDYFLLLIPVDVFFAWMAFGPSANAITFAYGIGGLALYTTGLTWVYWFIIDDY